MAEEEERKQVNKSTTGSASPGECLRLMKDKQTDADRLIY
jgi:hypothetical protein